MKKKIYKKFKPLGTRVLVRIVENEDISKSGIIIPGSTNKRPTLGYVVALGEKAGTEVTLNDKVMFSEYDGEDYSLDEEKFKVLNESEVQGIVHE